MQRRFFLNRAAGAGAYFPRDVMDAAYKASQELRAEWPAKNPDFAAIYPS